MKHFLLKLAAVDATVITILEILFWLCAGAILHTYLLFPLMLRLFASEKKNNDQVFEADEYPLVSILMSVYNEERVIREKLEKTFETDFPLDKLEVLIGSDCSDDETNAIIAEYRAKYPQIRLEAYSRRRGKPNVLNDLIHLAKGEVIILTDANVFFEARTIPELVKHFKNPSIGLVGANVMNTGIKKAGISVQESMYIQRETRMKYLEGIAWGAMMGPFGACYAMRKDLYAEIPGNFIVDDFYLCMVVFEKKKKAIIEPKAVCYEDVSNEIREEFRRKSRISAGNWQNLWRFAGLLWPPYTGVSFSFLSHKILRWKGPFYLIFCFVLAAILGVYNPFYQLLFFIQLALLHIPVIDQFLGGAGIHFKLFRFISHFYLMNLALLIGFFRWMKGVKSNTWKPTARNQ